MINKEQRKPRKIKRLLRWSGLSFSLLCIVAWLNNSSLIWGPGENAPELLAHRGLAQTFDLEGVKWNTNTARIIHLPEHPFLENTIEGIQAAYDYGADLVEFDVRLTRDNQLVVFHDYLLDYRTEKQGLVKNYTLAELQNLDIGYGYTHDGGLTYPFRGKGVGMMPSLEQVLATFPERSMLIHIKEGGVKAAKELESQLLDLPTGWQERVAIYGSKDAILYFRKNHPTIRSLTMVTIKKAVLQYGLIGWTGYVPQSMRNMEIHLPVNYARWLWGWPYRLVDRLETVNTRLVLVNGDGGFSSGFDSIESLDSIPENFSGCIWTDRIDIIGPYFRSEQ